MAESWLTKNIRPATCLILCAAAVVGMFLPKVDVPSELWDVLQFALGAYVIGRSGEKIVKEGGLPWQKPPQGPDGN